MFSNLIKPKPAQNSKLSDFVLNSSSSEKKRIYSQVIERAISSQVQVVNKVSATKR
jgi:peptidyl-tRNA hydrolase